MHKILVVDDSRSALMALKTQLDQNLFEVQTAQSAAEAMTILAGATPDCILSDYEMPETDGPTFCTSLKAIDRLKHVPVIILTSKAGTEVLLAAIAAGADDFLSKDSDVRIIAAKISAMIRIKKTQDELSQLKRVAGIKQIVATYNHEFNNPLTIAIGNLAFLRSAISDEGHLTRVHRAYDALERMAGLVRKIRELRDYVESNYSAGEDMISLPKAS